MPSAYPQDLATLVARNLAGAGAGVPERVLADLFEVMYFASLKTEEAEPVLCTLTYIDPDDPDPSPPSRIVTDRWSYIPFEHRVALQISTLAKVAAAIDPTAASLAVYADRQGQLFIWGMIDQSLQEGDPLATEMGDLDRPGLFQASITGVGDIVVYRGQRFVGGLNQHLLVPQYHDVLRSGPIHRILYTYIYSYVSSVMGVVREKGFGQQERWDERLVETWLGALSRVLLDIQRFRHGGGVLLGPLGAFEHLNAKYKIYYTRLQVALQKYAEKRMIEASVDDEILRRYLEPMADAIPVQHYLDKLIYGLELQESRDEIAGCIRFVASLSRVDGVVAIDNNLVVRGFGVEIAAGEAPAEVYIAGDAQGSEERLRPVDFNHFGTRHRSIMRYCYQHEGTIGFGISQDGDIRAMICLGRRLVLWENIKVRRLAI